MVGTFYAKPAPDKPDYVRSGRRVKPDTVVCKIEAMKIFNDITAELHRDGRRGVRQERRLRRVRPSCSGSDPARPEPCSNGSSSRTAGEIALRVIRACRDLGVEVAVVYSEADRGAPYLELADQAICIGPGPAAESYLKIARIIAAAEMANAEAIHPGYGFLSENGEFAEMCRECNIEFIGPPRRGHGRGSGTRTRRSSWPRPRRCRPSRGSDGIVTTDEEALKFARQIGYPVLIKAAAGGGGRGMRRRPGTTSACHRVARRPGRRPRPRSRTAACSWRSTSTSPGTSRCNCSATSTGTSSTCTSATARSSGGTRSWWRSRRPRTCRTRCGTRCATRPCGWRRRPGTTRAGTCEFLVDQHNNFYFIEVNARIQVEHPVTELVTGVDLIREQIRVAAGEKLRFRQRDIVQRGVGDRVPDQRRGPGERLPPVGRDDHDVAAAGRPGRAARLARGDRLPGAAELRLAWWRSCSSTSRPGRRRSR